MTAKEAKNELEKFVKLKTTLQPTFLSVAKDALEKQISNKPINKSCLGNVDKYVYGNCPNCGNGVNYEMAYCDNCGQRLDWSDTE